MIKKWLLPPGISGFLSAGGHAVVSQEDTSHIRELNKKGTLLSGIHQDEDCFILGAGPSIRQQDLRKLIGKAVISVSNTYVHEHFSYIKPRYHVLPSVFASHGRVYEEHKFLDWLSDMDKNLGAAQVVLHWGDKEKIEQNAIFTGRKCHWVEYVPWNEDFSTPIEFGRIPNIWSVSELALTLAVYCGFRKIYLLGFDHDWFNGPLNYFFDTQTQHKVKPSTDRLGYADAEYQMRRHAYIFKKYKYLNSFKQNIYNANANPDSYVDVFPKVDFNSLF
ncbi:MAG: hypothetical protein IT233_10325 [Bacteroidia bacterium]|nr:hypothetical protein [Bacteroidia bacterium]